MASTAVLGVRGHFMRTSVADPYVMALPAGVAKLRFFTTLTAKWD